ncbi:cell division protein ZipA C-terminal FtsZ-binding domain-containing protein [Carnimonas nigrificans]|uniref:cell division protein ZipA C-terminal FtsZ-binding domain-containing protein n=1 Tax=Carnimonas nigrificans TaxID=64323 RepID=UPI0004717E60|nr:cell division protein ZipA C-terminal FtsZ-binding domain-containing protein [Carnimonas nigrificans]
MELREWLIVLGLVFIVVIVIDGVRRYRKQQQIGTIDDQLVDGESEEERARETAWELPGGNARVVKSERVAAPDLQGGSFERRGLKTRVPFTEKGLGDEQHAFTEPHIGSNTALHDATVEPEPIAVESPSAPHIADAGDVDPKAAEAEAAAHAEASSAAPQLPATEAEDESAAPASAHHEPVAKSSEPQEHQPEEKHAQPVATADEPSSEVHDAEAYEEEAYAEEEYTEEEYEEYEGDDDEQNNGRRYGMFQGEEEEIDDPRYEGLSEILVKRPMDGVHRFQEAAAERREKRAIKREQARVKRLEDRARRAEEKAKRREEKEREAEALRQQREEQERLREQQRLEQEQQRRAEYESKARAEHEADRNERQRHEQLRSDDYRHRQADHEDHASDDDPLFAPSRHDGGYGSDPRESAMRHGVPYLGAVDTFEEDAPAERSRRRHDDHHDRVAPAAGSSRGYEEHEPAPRPAAERNWVRDLPEPEQKMHPVIEKALRHRVDGDVPREVLGNADELVIINVVSRSELGFKGLDLTKLFLACGLNYSSEGEMFHRFETEAADSPLQFSVINALKPGRFPIFDMEKFSTRCVSFLLPLPSAEHIGEAFDAMYETAKAIVRNLDGELRDENQSVMTVQTVGFLRQRVGDFERRMHLYRNSR